MSSLDGQGALMSTLLDIPVPDGGLIGARHKVTIVLRKVQAVDTVGVFGIASQNELVV